jgi:hypothetical protein
LVSGEQQGSALSGQRQMEGGGSCPIQSWPFSAPHVPAVWIQ